MQLHRSSRCAMMQLTIVADDPTVLCVDCSLRGVKGGAAGNRHRPRARG